MAITITYNRDKKTATVNGALGLASVETVTVVSDASAALAEGTVCLHVPGTDTALAEWAVAAGACETDTRAPALTGWFAARPALECADFTVRVKDADGNLLGAGCCPVVDSCATGEGADGFPATGGPLEAEAGTEIQAGCPCMIAEGLAQPCAAADHARFMGVALGHAESGETVRIVRWGAVAIPGWGLAPGASYWLPQSGQVLAQAPAGIALCVGTAQDADTLLLTGGRLAVQTADHALLGYAVWDAAERRIAIVPAATAGGAGAAGRIVAARADGTLDPAFLPAGIVTGALADLFAAVTPMRPETDGVDAINLKLNQILTILRGDI